VKTEAETVALSAGINNMKASVEIGDATLTGQDVTVEAKSIINSEVEAKASSGESFKGSVAVTVTDSDTSVSLDKTQIDAKNNASVSAVTEETIKTKAVTESKKEDDGSGSGSEGTKLSIGLPVNYTDIKNDNIIKNADIKAIKDITISGKDIKIENSKIKSTGATKGDVKITASDKGSELISTRKATIAISDTEIEGKDITIEATAENKYTYDDIESMIEVSDLTDGILGTVNEVLKIVEGITENKVSGQISKSDVSASITIGNTDIKADNNLNIKTLADSQATAKAKAENLAIAVGINNVESTINISGSNLEAGEDVNVKAKSKVTSEVEAKSASEELNGAVAVSVVTSETFVKLDGSEIQSGKDAAISAVTKEDIKIKADAEKGEGDNKISIGLGINYTEIEDKVDMQKTGIEAYGNIDIFGKNIKIAGGSSAKPAILSTGGNVTIKAEDKGSELISTRSASVNISNMTIEGEDVTIKAIAENKYEYDDVNSLIEVSDLTNGVLGSVNEILEIVGDLTDDAVRGKIAKSDVSATITIDNTDIKADNDLSITTLADSQTTAKAEAKNLSIAAGVNMSKSKINITNTGVSAGKDAAVEAKTIITSEVEAKSDSEEKFKGAVAVSVIDSDRSVSFDKSKIEAGNDIKISSVVTEEERITKAITENNYGNFSIGLGIQHTEIEDKVEIQKTGIEADGDIDIFGKNITITGGDSAAKSAIAAQGNVTIKAEDKGSELISTRKASIDISDAEISGHDVTIEAIAENKYKYEEVSDITEVSTLEEALFGAADNILDIIKDLTGGAVSGKIAKSKVEATITIKDTDINAANDLNITTLADSQTTAKSEAKNLALSLGVNLSKSEINITDSGLSAGQDATIEAKSKITSDVEANSDADSFNAALAVSVAISETSVNLDNNTTINAENDASISSITEEDRTTKAITEKSDGNFSIGLGVNYTDLKNDVDVKGSIKAGNNIKIASQGDNRRSVGDTDLKIKADIIAGKSVDIAGKNIKITDSLITADGTAESVEADEEKGIEAKEGDHIKIVASDKGSELISTRKASADIQNTIITGKSEVIIEANAENTYKYDDLSDTLEIRDLTDTALGITQGVLTAVKDLTGNVVDGKIAKSDVKANINISGDTVINAEKDLSIKTLANSQATAKAEADNLALAAGVNLTESKIDINNATLNAVNDVTVEAKSIIASEVEAKSASDEQFKGAVAVSVADSRTLVSLDNAKIEAGNNALISATTKEDIKKINAITEKGEGGISIGFGVNYADIKNDVEIKKKAAINAVQNIDIYGKNIKIEDSSIKSIGATKGDVKIIASDKGAELISTRKASIEISGSDIDGKDVSIEANAKNEYEYDKVNSVIEVSSLTDMALGIANEVLTVVKDLTGNVVDGKIAKSGVSANITIKDTIINADKDIKIATSANSQATAKAEADNLAFAAGVNLVESKINVSNTELQAVNDVIIEAKSTITSEVEAKSASDEKYKGAVALSLSDAVTSVNIDLNDKIIDAGHNVTISAVTEKDINTNAITEKGEEGISIGVAANYTDLKNDIDVKGSITAGNDITISSEGDNRRFAGELDLKIEAVINAAQNIDISGKNIKIENSEIKSTGATKGDVTITASDIGSELISTRKASIEISGSTIEGNDVVMEATAKNKYEYDDLSDTLEIKDLTDTALGITQEVLSIVDDLTGKAISGKIAKSDVSANITIDKNTEITADNDININTSVESQTTVKTDAKGLGVSVGVNLSESKIGIGKASLSAGNNINLNAENNITSEVEAKSGSYSLSEGVDIGGAVGVSVILGNTSVELSKDSMLNAKNNALISANTEKDISLTVESKTGAAGIAVGVNVADVNNSVAAKGEINAKGDVAGDVIGNVDINSTINSKNTKQSVSVIPGSAGNEEEPKDEGMKFDEDNLNKLQGKINVESADNKTGSDGSSSTIALAGAVLYSKNTNTAISEISGADAKIEAKNNINIKAEVINANIMQFVDASVSNAGKVSGTGAVLIGNYTDTAKAFVDGATIDAGNKIDISSRHEIPIDNEWLDIFKDFENNPDFDSAEEIYEKLKETGGEGLINSRIMSSAPESAGEEDGQSFSVSASGAVNITKYDFTSEAYIKDAKVNQKEPPLQTGEQTVNVEAKSKSSSITLGGIFGDDIMNPLGQSGSNVGVGGTYNQTHYNTTTNAFIEGSTKLFANDLNVKAVYDQLDISIGVAGGESKTFGLQGVFNWLKSDSLVNASIKDADIKIESGSLPDGKINIEAVHTPILVNVAGSLSMSEKAAVGASVSLLDIDRNTNAFIKNAAVNTNANADILAINNGLIHSYMIAAAPAISGNVGIAGAVGIGNLNNNANAYIDNSTIVSGGSIGLLADNKNNIGFYSGAVGIGSSVGIGGNISLHFINSRSNAGIFNDSDITAKGGEALGSSFNGLSGLVVKSNVFDDIFVVNTAAAGSGSVAVSGGISGSIVSATSSAKIENSKINENYSSSDIQYGDEAGVHVTAENETDVTVIAGAVSAAGTAAVGVAADFETMSNTVEAYIGNSIINAKGDVKVKTKNTEKYAATVVSGALGGSAGVAGNVVVAVNESENRAYINKSTIDARDVTVEAEDSVTIGEVHPSEGKLGIAMGTLAAGAYAGVAGTVFTSVISNSTKAEIIDSKITALGNIKLDAEGYQKTFANLATFGGAIAGIGITAGVSVNNTETAALIRRSDGNAKTYNLNAQNININAKNTLEVDKIFVGGAVGLAGVTVGVSVGVYNNNVTAGMGSGIYANASQNVGVRALNDRNIKDIVVSMAGGFVGVTATVDVIVVGGNVDATDTTAEDDANGPSTNTYLSGEYTRTIMVEENGEKKEVEVTSNSKQEIGDNMKMSNRIDKDKVGGGLVDTDAMSNFDYNYDELGVYNAPLKNGTFAYIDGNVTAGGNVGVSAADNVDINANIGAASAGFVAVGASVAVQDLKTLTDARIGGTISANNINITANSDTKNTTGIYMGGGGFVAVNAGVAVINSNNTTNAYIANGVEITKANNINILANANSLITPKFFNASVGAGAVGAVVGVVNKKGSTDAWIGDDTIIGYWPTPKSIEGKPIGGSEEAIEMPGTEIIEKQKISVVNRLIIEAQTDNKVNATMESASGGVGSASANIFVVNVTDNLNAYTGTGSKLNLYDLNVLTNGNTAVNANFIAASLAGALAIAASVANSNININNKAYIGENNTISAKNDVSVFAAHSASANLYALGGVGAGLAALNGIIIKNNIEGNVKASILKGSEITADNDLEVSSNSNADLKSEGNSGTISALSVGLTYAENKAAINTITEFEDKLTIKAKNLYAGTDSFVGMLSKAQSGAGGLGVFGGAEAITTNDSSNKVLFGDSKSGLAGSNIETEKFEVNAKAKSEQNGSIWSAAAGLGTIGLFYVENTSNVDLNVIIGGSTNILANDFIIRAENTFSKPDIGYNIDSHALSAIGIFFAEDKTTIENSTNVVFEEDTTVKTYAIEIEEEYAIEKKEVFPVDDEEEDEEVPYMYLKKVSTFLVDVHNIINAVDNVKYEAFASGSGAHLVSKIDNNSTAKVLFDGTTFSAKDLIVNARTDQNIKTNVYMNIGAGISGITGESINKSVNNNKIEIGDSGNVLAGQNLFFNLARDENKEWATYGVTSIADIYNMALIPVNLSSKATADLTNNNIVTVNGILRSVGDINIYADEGSTTGNGLLSIYTPYGETGTKAQDRKFEVKQNSEAEVNGYVRAGLNNRLHIVIDNDGDDVKVDISNPDGIDPDRIEWWKTRESIENNMLEEIKRLEKAIVTFSGDEILKGAYEAELNNLYNELASLDLLYRDPATGILIPMSKREVEYITFSDIYANRGDIWIHANNISGSGTLDAPGYAEIDIQNRTNINLRLKDVMISKSSTGAIMFNGISVTNNEAINKNNESKTANLTILSKKSSDGAPEIKINNSSFANKPNLELTGEIENRGGSINIYSEGNIKIKKSVRGENIFIESRGDITQSFYSGFQHIGVNPADYFNYSGSVVNNNQTNKPATDSKDISPVGSRYNGIIGNNVTLSARYLNINGFVQAGIADWDLTIYDDPLHLLNGHTVESAIADYYSLAVRRDGAEYYKLDARYYGNNIDAYYNVLTNEIAIKDISVEGGRLQIYGTIFSTGVGELRALDGYGKINIDNRSGYDLKIGNIYNEGVKGVISITDTNFKYNGKFLTTEYTYENGNINSTYYIMENGIRTTPSDANFNRTQRIGSDVYYKPLADQRYEWTNWNGTETKYTYTKTEIRGAILGIIWKREGDFDWGAPGKPEVTTQMQALKGGEILYKNGNGSAYQFKYTYELDGPRKIVEQHLTEDGNVKPYQTDPIYGPLGIAVIQWEDKYRKVEAQNSKHYYTHNIKADYNIQISFIGYDPLAANPSKRPSLDITSANNITLAGNISNPVGNVNITSQQGYIDTTGAISIFANDLTLSAAKGIAGGSSLGGGIQNIDASLINVKLNNGNILTANTLEGNINLKSNENLVFSNIVSGNGIVKLYAEESILGNNANSKIQGKELDLVADTGRIGLKNDKTALLEINADIISAYAGGEANNINLIKKEKGDLGIKQIKSSGDVNLAVSNGSVYDVIGDAEMDPRTKDELLALWNSLDLFSSREITDEEGDVIGYSQAWTEDQLMYAINSSREIFSTQKVTDNPNIVATGNININAGGSIGRNSEEFYFGIENKFSDLTDSQKLLIATAKSSNIIWDYIYELDENGKKKLDEHGNPIKKELIGITVIGQENLYIDGKGNVNFNANGDIYIGSKNDIKINQIKSGGNVIIESQKGIYSASSDRTNIIGNNVELDSDVGDIGASGNGEKLTLDMSGILTAVTRGGSIYLGSENNLTLDFLSATESIYVNGANNIFSSGYGGATDYINVKARSINIEAANVGTTTRNLSIALIHSYDDNGKLEESGILNVSAIGNIYINNIGIQTGLTDLYFGNLTAGGYLSVMSKYGAILAFDENYTISAKNLFLGASNSYIGTEDNKIKVNVAEIISASAKGDIYIEAQVKGNFEDVSSSDGLVDLSSTKDLYADKIYADKNINITAKNGSVETGKQNITSENGKITISGKNEVEVKAVLTAKGDIEIQSKESDLKVSGEVVSSEGKVALNSEGKTEIVGNITAEKDITADSQKELMVKGDLESKDGGVDLKSGKKTDIEGAITAKETIKALVENGDFTIKGAIRSLDGNINFNILNGALIIGNKVVSERGVVFADAYGDITGDRASITGAGIYADEIRLVSQNGDIGKPNNNLYLDSANSVSVLANLTALNGGIYVEGFTNGLTIERFASGKDLFIESAGDIMAKDLGNKEPNIIAANITLHSLTGSIGKENASIIVEPVKEKGKVNLSAVTGIYVAQYVRDTFYSDYVRNSGKGKVSLLVPNNNAFIVDLSVLPGTDVNIRFADNMHVKNVSLGFKNIKNLMINPAALWAPVFKTASEERYDLLNEEKIVDKIEKLQNETLVISSSK